MAGARGCNPLTGLFVCDTGKEVFRREYAQLQSPYGAFCLRLDELGEEHAQALSCNPLTGLFVCDPDIVEATEAWLEVAIPLRGFLFATGRPWPVHTIYC